MRRGADLRYNLELIKDWLQNRGNPKAHMRVIEAYQEGLLSSQKSKMLQNKKIRAVSNR